MDKNDSSCMICGMNGQGNHFGVVSCRACAAFFRRTADSKWSRMKCLSRHCDGKTYHCKPCRLKRCRDVGMDPSKFQHNRDALMTSRKRKLPQTLEHFVGTPHFVLFCSSASDLESGQQKTFVDLSILVSKAIEIMRMGPPTPIYAKNPLEKLGNGMNSLKMRPEHKKLDRITRIEIAGIWEFHLLTVAKWIVNFDKFQVLEPDLKLKILFAMWHVWGRLDKLMATAQYRERDENAKETERVFGNGLVKDMVTFDGDATWMTNCPLDTIGYFLDGICVWDLYSVIEQLIELKLSETELTFMLAQLSFEYVGARFGGAIREMMDAFQAELSDNLHDYYLNERNMVRYSGRLMQMLRINKEIQENIRKYRPRAEVAKIFDVFKLDFSHPDMFKDTGFV
ncbi:unnamed protein product [Caenorhabditis sp. 36 PRJEB53466]|nr:unnamed protein product [Caenorhabditis sp. 36 PRJEB53466]